METDLSGLRGIGLKVRIEILIDQRVEVGSRISGGKCGCGKNK